MSEVPVDEAMTDDEITALREKLRRVLLHGPAEKTVRRLIARVDREFSEGFNAAVQAIAAADGVSAEDIKSQYGLGK